ncbi:lipoyl synthase [Candidatus Woesearchaeota archaeon]|nr:lipoyl synthase [Candidatus Woesearchaeota archaeon]
MQHKRQALYKGFEYLFFFSLLYFLHFFFFHHYIFYIVNIFVHNTFIPQDPSEEMLVQISQQIQKTRKPEWLKVRLPTQEHYFHLKQLLRKANLHTVCEEAACPNIYECFSKGVATFMIMGDTCTRYCHYCHVKTGKPNEIDVHEPQHIAESIQQLNLNYVVITSVTRDDLPDGGAQHFANTIKSIQQNTNCSVEVLTQDFQYKEEDIKKVVDANPQVYAHNIETVERVYKRVRPKGVFQKSLELLQTVKKINPAMPTKSGFMLGLGETKEEIITLMKQLRTHECDFLCIGQYLQPTPKHAKVEKFYAPSEFKEFEMLGYQLGFKHVEAGPLVRSSYRADKLRGKL